MVEAAHREQISPHHDHLRPILDGENGVRRGPEHFAHGEQRHDIAFGPYSDHQATDNGKRQRHLKSKCGALPSAGLNLDMAPQLLDLLPHHIHSHSAAGDVGNPRRRGETGFKYEMKGFVLRKMLRIADQSLLHGLGQDALRVQPPSVVGYLDDDVARLVTRAQANAGQGFFARRRVPIPWAFPSCGTNRALALPRAETTGRWAPGAWTWKSSAVRR